MGALTLGPPGAAAGHGAPGCRRVAQLSREGIECSAGPACRIGDSVLWLSR